MHGSRAKVPQKNGGNRTILFGLVKKETKSETVKKPVE